MIRAAALLVLVALPVRAQESPEAAARAAIVRIEAAAEQLDTASGARDRVRALTQTVRAYETGLGALREGLRRASVRESEIAARLDARRDEIARLLGVLLTIARTPEPTLLLHPSGPMGTARSAMILADVTPALQAEADRLAANLEELQILTQLQATAIETLQAGLEGAAEARTQLSAAISNRTDLPRRYTEDPERMSLLIAATETLEGFATSLAEIGGPDTAAAAAISAGNLLPPVAGVLVRRAGEADAAGIARPGVLIATEPGALVTTPFAATVRYTGPLLDQGLVAVLEPIPDHLLILSGLAQTFGTEGEVLAEGAPVGLMGGSPPQGAANLTEGVPILSPTRSETLYIELRNSDGPIDPATWFALEQD